MKKIKGFTLVEVIISVTLFAIIIVMAFDVMGNIWIMRAKLSNRLDINQDIYVAIESIVSNIKDFNWDVDYEEYWNRFAVWDVTTSSGHYNQFSWYGNYWSWWDVSTNTYWDIFYFCRSWVWLGMWTWWCLAWYNDYWDTASFAWKYQRFWQYAFEFFDYNSNQSNDTTDCTVIWKPWMSTWDEDCDGKIRWDEDDEPLWLWPTAFSGNQVREIYLIRKGKVNERLLMRLNIKKDPSAPSTYTCDVNWTWSWCIGNIQVLKLVWYDLWMSHSWSVTSSWQYDWIIDTWWCNKDYSCNWADNLPNYVDDWWIDLLPSYINVKDFKIFIYPNLDYNYAWKSAWLDSTINPYIRINMSLGYSWERKKQLKWNDPTINITTSINLTNN